MARKKYKRPRIEGRFIALTNQMLNSPAWRSLSLPAIFVFIELKKKFNGHNKDNLSLTYKELKYKLSTATVRKAFKQLEETGFILLIKQGGLYRGCNIYGLCERWQVIKPALNPEADSTIIDPILAAILAE